MNCELPSAYLAPIPFYAAMLQTRGTVLMEQYDHYVKQTFRNRCIITGPNGQQVLTIPVEKPQGGGKSLMRDLRISDHGNWRHLHWNALESSYGRSPFFEYYADDLRPFYEKKWEFLIDYNEALQQKMFELLDIEIKTERTEQYEPTPQPRPVAWSGLETQFDSMKNTIYNSSILNKFLDLRSWAEPSAIKGLPFTPYYQVFRDRNGFQSHLSIVDLLFNMGPEAVLILNKTDYP